MTDLSTLSLHDLKKLETRIAQEIVQRQSSTKKALLKRFDQMARTEGFIDSVKQHGRFTDNHLGRSTGIIVGGYSVMFVAPSG